jgi:RNA polymerase sigma-70 factor, ECF subfamily
VVYNDSWTAVATTWTAIHYANILPARKALLFRGSADDIVRKRAAVTGLYETHFERVSRYIAVRIGSISEAEELASEVFLRALRSAESYKETGAPMEAWLFKIAHNVVANYLRDRSRHPAHVPIDETIIVANPSPGDQSQARVPVDEAFSIAARENPVDDLERQEEIEQLHQAMKQLSGAQRQVLALRFGAEISSQEVAEIMGKNPGAVREMQSAAIKKLREIMEGSQAKV